MNAFNRVVNIQGELFRYLNILPRPRIRKMTAHKDVEVVSEELVEYLHVLMKIRRDIEPVERSIAGGYAVNGHQEFGLRDIDEKIALIRMIIVAAELDSLASKRKRFLRFESYVGQQSIRIFYFL